MRRELGRQQPLWQPSEARARAANITRFIDYVNRTHGLNIENYAQLYEWSITEIADFWAVMWEFGDVRASAMYETVLEDLRRFPGARWFSGARLNFAENLLRFRDGRPALIFRGETSRSRELTYSELYQAVADLAAALRDAGVGPGHRVAGYMPNLPETAIAMLAAASIGAVWSSCATDIGPAAALERLGQIQPKVLFTADGYFYKGKEFGTLRAAGEVAGGIPSLERVIVVSYVGARP